MQSNQTLAIKALHLLFRPVVRLALRHAISIQQVTEVLKRTFVEVAAADISREGEKSNVSRISVVTGLHRRDVLRILENQAPPEPPINLISKIISQWENDQEFQTRSGKPRLLSCEGAQCEFNDLVRSVSSDVHPATVLFQLERLKLVDRTPQGLKFITAVYEVREDLEKGYHLLAQDIDDLTQSVEENLLSGETLPQLHARTDYDNVFLEDLPTIREWLLREGALLHQRARAFISQFDQDLNPHIRKQSGARVALGTFGRVTAPDSSITAKGEKI